MKNTDVKQHISALWIVVMLNLIFADVLSIMLALTDKSRINIIGDATITMTIAAIVTNIPILMIYFSKTLQYRANRIVNIIAAILTIVYIIGGGDTAPHYIILASIETICLFVIITKAWRWKEG
ncbi:MAG: hypothetical protein J0L80_07865 [Chitinophagales bacterium]|jgi:hypothetical protein|nr:hypothetical protein [Chitinophagales bacterium]